MQYLKLYRAFHCPIKRKHPHVCMPPLLGEVAEHRYSPLIVVEEHHGREITG